MLRLEGHTDYKEQPKGCFYNNPGQLQYKRYYNSDVTIDGINQNYDTGPENNRAEQIEYTYDTLGRRTTVEVKDNPNTYIRTTTYHYDARGLRNRCISVLLAYLMIVGAAGFEHITHASTQYGEPGTSS